jgi:peptide/nickel transport system substrate-binding protein
MTAPEGKREFRILGPFEARKNGRALEIGAGKQRALLAFLLLDAGAVVSTDRLIDALWGERPPASALNSVHVYVSQLRKVLGEGCLLTRGHGYLLALEPEQVDLGRFERMLGEGRELLAAGEATRASGVLQAALALWRGPPLADLASEPFAQGEIARLDELHLAALEERIEADLALGRHDQLVPELEALVRANPLRERLRAQLMLALYRSGRQAEALEAYRQGRMMLVQEVGLEPGRRLQELERAILSQDPALDPPAPAAAPLRRPRHRGGLLIAIGATLLLAAGIAVAVIELSRGGGAGHVNLAEQTGSVVGVLDADSGDVKAVVELTAPPRAVAAGLGYVWVVSADSNAVYAIDPKTNTEHDKIEVQSAPAGIAVGGDYVWVTNSLTGTVSQIDPRALIVLQSIPVGNGPTGVAARGGYVWVANTLDHKISKIRASTGRVLGTYPAGTDPGAVAVGEGAVWVASKSGDTVVKVNPTNGQLLKTIHVGRGPAAVAVGLSSVWVANSVDRTVMQIDPASDRVVSTEKVGANPSAIRIVHGAVWTANELAGTVSRVDPASLRRQTIPVGGRPSALATERGNVYVALRPTGTAHRGGTLRVASASLEPLTTLDLAVGSLSSLWRFSALTNDGLLAYRRVTGQAGYQLVPDLARSIPTVTPDMKTYTFELRRHVRYSNGQPVRASDFRYGIERAFKLRRRTDPDTGGAGDIFRAIRGADRCHGRRCHLAAGIVTDDRARTIAFHLSDPDPYFLYKLTSTFAAAVPAGTSLWESTRQPLPATGPYRVVSATRDSVRLARNSSFREWSEPAQPDGFPDEIVLKTVSIKRGIALVEEGKADLTSSLALEPFPIAPNFRPQVRAHPLAGIGYLVLDPNRPPFDNLRARRALNYAVDRNKIAQLTTERSEPTCQVLPPNFPGYHRYCPYTVPSPDGAWAAPDPARAARLVAASGTAGASVTLWVDRDFVGNTRIGRYLKRLLKGLRYRPQLRESWPGTPRSYFAALEHGIMSHRRGPQVAFAGWAADYPAASNFIRDLFSCHSEWNYSRLCDPALEQRIRQAVELEQADPLSSNRLWAELDHEITDRALWVPLYNGYRTDLVSKRVGNYQYNPQYGPLLSQLWVR